MMTTKNEKGKGGNKKACRTILCVLFGRPFFFFVGLGLYFPLSSPSACPLRTAGRFPFRLRSAPTETTKNRQKDKQRNREKETTKEIERKKRSTQGDALRCRRDRGPGGPGRLLACGRRPARRHDCPRCAGGGICLGPRHDRLRAACMQSRPRCLLDATAATTAAPCDVGCDGTAAIATIATAATTTATVSAHAPR